MPMSAFLGTLLISFLSFSASEHPLRLSLCEVEYDAFSSVDVEAISHSVNEALVFDPYSEELPL